MKRHIILPLLLLALALSACGISEADIQLTVVAAETNAVSTAYVQLTEYALANPSATPTLLPTATLMPTLALTPTTIGGTGMGTGTGTGTTTSCGGMTFVSDVTVPDGEEIAAGTAFTKTWSLQNSGTCEWTTAFQLIFSHGEQMGGPSSNPLPAAIAVGSNGNVSVSLVAPSSAGEYVGHWALVDASGAAFGYLYVEIKVP
ncbi:MAG TPA: NBR1-Ig-like domain-containing protein [Anaerolineales bacterium]|nr:NBR1-Ig-like domain-containing protein [Anaerolineales bacterium]HRQ91264.1 NBR1-Ig-like domain-containing protein [Anaerolineales bacterium]